MKKSIVNISIYSIIILTIIIMGLSVNNEKMCTLTISNNTNISLTSIKIYYSDSEKPIEIPVINSNDDYSINYSIPLDMNKNKVIISYEDYNKKNQDIIIENDLNSMQNADMNTLVEVNSVTEDGRLVVDNYE